MDASAKHAAAMAVADAVRAELGLGPGLERFATGSVPVFAAGSAHVIKLFPAHESRFFEAERAALTHLAGKLPIATPRFVAGGLQDGWWYVAMTRLPGRLLSDAWPALERDERRHRCTRSAPPPELARS
jgi:hygromycin-B 7''-O-kinase